MKFSWPSTRISRIEGSNNEFLFTIIIMIYGTNLNDSKSEKRRFEVWYVQIQMRLDRSLYLCIRKAALELNTSLQIFSFNYFVLELPVGGPITSLVNVIFYAIRVSYSRRAEYAIYLAFEYAQLRIQ